MRTRTDSLVLWSVLMVSACHVTSRAASARSPGAGAPAQPTLSPAQCERPKNDSSRIACVALDTVQRGFHLPSLVLRYEMHGDSIRIVTTPDQTRIHVLDGMGVVWLARNGSVLSVTVTDSA